MNFAFETNLIIILTASLIFWLGFLKLVRNIKSPFSADNFGDNENLVAVAAKANEWKWPSDMHIKTYAGKSTYIRDVAVLLVVLFQRIFRDKKSLFPVSALWSFATIVSTLLIFLISNSYWGANVALLVSAFYLISFWSWQTSLFVGHINVANMFFFLAVYLLTQSVGTTSLLLYAWLFAAGTSFGAMLFSSSSSHRYITAFFAAAFFAKHQTEISLSGFYETISNNHSILISMILTAVIITLLFLLKAFCKKITTAIYYKKASRILNNIIEQRKYPLDHYIKEAKEKLDNIPRWFIKPYIFLFIVLNVIGFNYFIPILFGFTLICCILTLPNIKRNLGFYFSYIYISYILPDRNSQFVRYVKSGYFAKKNISLPPNPRGGGLSWLPKIYFRMAPFHTAIYILTIIAIVIVNLVQPILSLGPLLLLIAISLSPILWAELTKAVQISKSYFSGLIGFLPIVGFGASIFSQRFPNFWPFAVTLLAVIFLWNLWKFFTDIYPARMGFANIIKAFRKFKIKEIYTYKTFYNNPYFDNRLDQHSLKNLKINYIKSLKEVKNGWIFIPDTSHKGGFVPQDNAAQFVDFTEDPILNKLLETGQLEKIATAKFKTFGTSNIWRQEGEVPSYLDLMLHEITEEDRFRAYAWLLHSSRLRPILD